MNIIATLLIVIALSGPLLRRWWGHEPEHRTIQLVPYSLDDLVSWHIRHEDPDCTGMWMLRGRGEMQFYTCNACGARCRISPENTQAAWDENMAALHLRELTVEGQEMLSGPDPDQYDHNLGGYPGGPE